MKITIDNKEIKYIVLDDKGKVIETGEEEGFDTFQFTVFDLKTIKVGEYPKLCFNTRKTGKYVNFDSIKEKELRYLDKKVKEIWTDLNYKILCVE